MCVGSPFTVNVGGQPSGRVTERIERQQQALTQTTSVGSLCQLNISLAGMDLQNIAASVTSPSGATEHCELQDLGANRYTVKFVPREMGVHTVSLKHQGLHIPGDESANGLLMFYNDESANGLRLFLQRRLMSSGTAST